MAVNDFFFVGAKMNRALLLSLSLFFLSGCDIPYKAEYEKAMELKEKAEQKAAEAQAAAEQAQNKLTDEQEALNRIYNED